MCGSIDELPPDAAAPVFTLAWPAPSQAPAVRVELVACGFDFSFLVLENGWCFAWGNNSHGQLGLGSSELARADLPRFAAAAVLCSFNC